MAREVILDAVVYISGNDVSQWCKKIEEDTSYAEQDTTTFGDGGSKTVVGGLDEGSIALDFINDYTASSLNDIMSGLRSRTPVTMSYKRADAVVSSANKLHTGSILLNSWQDISGNVGELPNISRTYTKSGAWATTTTG